jgi:hypothetical protein
MLRVCLTESELWPADLDELRGTAFFFSIDDLMYLLWHKLAGSVAMCLNPEVIFYHQEPRQIGVVGSMT